MVVSSHGGKNQIRWDGDLGKTLITRTSLSFEAELQDMRRNQTKREALRKQGRGKKDEGMNGRRRKDHWNSCLQPTLACRVKTGRVEKSRRCQTPGRKEKTHRSKDI